jgi:ferredoxin
MAIVTLVVCGGVIVYLLGNKGFCTYVCPYGAFFAVADRMALGRIRVTDACAGCGQCTAACTSNVRVHAEVRDFGMVLDSSCMKCMDCVSVCPNDALYFGFSSPSRHTGARPTGPAHNKTYDFTLTEDLLALAVAGFTMFAMRGLYDGPPFLLAVALGVINGFLAVAIIRLARRQNAHLASFQVRRAGRLTRAGKVAVITAALWFAFVAHSFSVQYLRHQGMAALRNIHITWEESASPRWTFANASDHDRRNIHLARASLEKADNFGLLDWSDVKLGLAWIAMLQGDREIAATYLGEAIKLSHESEQLREMLLELRS